MDFFSTAALAASGVVLLVQQILKLKIVPVAIANRYPVETNVVLSIVATYLLVPIDWSVDNIGHILVQIASVAVTAAVAYNQLVSRSDTVKSLEG